MNIQLHIDELADIITQFLEDYDSIAEENKIVIDDFCSIKEFSYCLSDRIADSDIFEAEE